MAIEEGNQVLPTGGFEGFADDDDSSDSLSALDTDDNDDLDNDDPDGGEGVGIIAEVFEKGTEGLDDDPEPEPKSEPEPEPTPDEVAAAKAAEDEATALKEAEDDFIPEVEEEGEAPLAEGETPKVLTKKEKFERYSRSVQRRINKGTKQREELREENRALHERIANIENGLQQTQVNNDAAVLDKRLRNATAIKQQLLEEGEYARAAEVDNDIIEMRIRKNDINSQAAQRTQEIPQHNAPPAAQPSEQNQRPAAQQTQPGQAEPEYVPAAQSQWIKNNQRFGREPGYTSYVNENYDRMIAQGYNPEHPSMYVELDKRIGRSAPAAAESELVAEPIAEPAAELAVAPAAKPRAQSAPTPNTGQQAQTPTKAKGLTEADKTNMLGWGLDPKNVNQRKEWLKNKKA